jgi:hypothetical protein
MFYIELVAITTGDAPHERRVIEQEINKFETIGRSPHFLYPLDRSQTRTIIS